MGKVENNIFRWALGGLVVSGQVIWKLSAEKHHKPRILYPAKLSFKKKKENKD